MIRRVLFSASFAIWFAFATLSLAATADFNGVWKGQVEFPDGQSRDITYTLKVDGEKLTGSIESPRGKAEISDGKVTADGITFNTIRDGNPIAHEGKLADGKLKITVHTQGGDREYTLSQPAADAPKAAASGAAASGNAAAGKIDGKWQGKIKDEMGNDIDLLYDLKADGAKLTGTVEGPVGKLDLENGTIDGDKLKFQVSFGDFHIQHDAQLADGKIKITSHMPMGGDREYTITRAKPDISGKWEAMFKDDAGNDMPLKFDLKVDGEKLTGTVKSDQGDGELSNGKINGDKISFDVDFKGEIIKHEGAIADKEIKLNVSGFGTKWDLTLKRPAAK